MLKLAKNIKEIHLMYTDISTLNYKSIDGAIQFAFFAIYIHQ